MTFIYCHKSRRTSKLITKEIWFWVILSWELSNYLLPIQQLSYRLTVVKLSGIARMLIVFLGMVRSSFCHLLSINSCRSILLINMMVIFRNGRRLGIILNSTKRIIFGEVVKMDIVSVCSCFLRSSSCLINRIMGFSHVWKKFKSKNRLFALKEVR